MFNEIIVIDRLANKPAMKETQNGIELATIVLDVERPYRNNLGINDYDYITCVLWKGISLQVMDCCDIGSFFRYKGAFTIKNIWIGRQLINDFYGSKSWTWWMGF